MWNCFCCFLRNTFVLEYCGEVLDHKEFKTRVKEYARNKNIHYYFMSLKNNEVSDDLTHQMASVNGFNGYLWWLEETADAVLPLSDYWCNAEG